MLRLIVLVAATVCAYGAVDRTASIIPPYGTLIGVSMDYGAYQGNISRYEAQLTRSPAAFVLFLWFPLRDWEVEASKAILQQIGARKRIALVTLEPFEGLEKAQDPAALVKLSEQVLAWEQMGVNVIVRFAHEMNGEFKGKRIEWYCCCHLSPLLACSCTAAAGISVASNATSQLAAVSRISGSAGHICAADMCISVIQSSGTRKHPIIEWLSLSRSLPPVYSAT
jgi:hypothetical protein